MDAHKNPNLETANNHHVRRRRRRSPTVPSTCSQDFKKTHEELLFMKDLEGACDDHKVINKSSLLDAGEGGDKAEESTTPPPPPPPEPEASMVDESGRERLKRHRVEMSGRVWIPDIWGQEDLLQKWIDCTVFDSSIEKNMIMSARDALIQEGRSTVRIENSC